MNPELTETVRTANRALGALTTSDSTDRNFIDTFGANNDMILAQINEAHELLLKREAQVVAARRALAELEEAL